MAAVMNTLKPAGSPVVSGPPTGETEVAWRGHGWEVMFTWNNGRFTISWATLPAEPVGCWMITHDGQREYFPPDAADPDAAQPWPAHQAP